MASQRTKNRVNEHSDHWEETGHVLKAKFAWSTAGLDGRECLEFTCGGKCNWSGWLPTDELKELGVIT